jgi:hypothetical protein
MEPLESGCQWEEDPVGNANSHDGRSVRRDLRSKTAPVRLAIAKKPKPDAPNAEIYSIGMERIAYRLGTLLGLPIPETYLEDYLGEPSCIQRRVLQSASFRQMLHLPMRAEVSNIGLFAKAALFDVLLANIDRRDVNLLFEAEPEGARCEKATCCRLWLIDHGHCGLWPAAKFDPGGDPAAIDGIEQPDGALHQKAEQVIRDVMPEAYRRPLEQANDAEVGLLLDVVRQVVDDVAIGTAVQEVPERYMPGNVRAATEAFLKARRDRLDEVLHQYWQP